MANDLLLPIQAGTLPSGFCPTTYQDMLNGFSAVQNAVLATNGGGGTAPVASGFVVSATKPTSHNVAWLQLDTNQRPIRLYYYFGGWLSLHPIQPYLTMWWFNALPDFYTFDGGDSSTPDLAGTTGPMWQVAQDANNTPIAAKFPVAAGTLPSSTILSVPGSGGEETHKLVAAEVAPHTHFLSNAGLNGGADANVVNAPSGILVGDRNRAASVPGADVGTKANTGDGTSITAAGHNTMPPYVVGYLLQRTTRLYYKVT